MIEPNAVIVSFDGKLVHFPMSGDGTLFDGEEFGSTYNIEPNEIVFASFNEKTMTSIELGRFAIRTGPQDSGDFSILQLFKTDGKQLRECVKRLNQQLLNEPTTVMIEG